MRKMDKEFYTTQELADKLRVNVMTIYRYIKAARLKAYKIGREFRIDKEEFDRFLGYKGRQNKNNSLKKRGGVELNRIYAEDCLNTMAKMPNGFVDLTVTSPPYDNLRSYSGNPFPFDSFKLIAEELYRITKNGGVVVWVVGDQTIKGNETGTSFKQALYFKQIGFNLFDTMMYLKAPRGAVGNNKTYWQTFEYMFVLSKGTPKTINLIRDRENKEARSGDSGTKRLHDGSLLKQSRSGYSTHGRRTNVWDYLIGRGHSASDKIAYEHPAIFPEKLAADHILSWSNKGDVVYDPFMGSGTTAKMAILNDRAYIGSELYTKYCKLAERRLAPILAKKRLL